MVSEAQSKELGKCKILPNVYCTITEKHIVSCRDCEVRSFTSVACGSGPSPAPLWFLWVLVHFLSVNDNDNENDTLKEVHPTIVSGLALQV